MQSDPELVIDSDEELVAAFRINPEAEEASDEDIDEDIEETDDVLVEGEASEDPFTKPGLPRTFAPASKPRETVAVRQFSFTVPATEGLIRSMLAFEAGEEGFKPANGVPVPSSTSSMISPAGFFSRRRKPEFARVTDELTRKGSDANRDEPSCRLAITRYSPWWMTVPEENVTMTASVPVLFRYVME